MQLPQKIKLKPEQAKALGEIRDRQLAIQQFVQMISQQGESRLKEIAADARSVWTQLAAEHGLDLQHVNYELDETGELIEPVAMRLRA